MAEDIQIESMVTITGAEYVRLTAENAKLRAALERIAELPVGYADMNQDHVTEVLTHKDRTALGGEND